jgi:hypothetical protein
MADANGDGEGSRNKVERVARAYGLEDHGDRLVDSWLGDGERRRSTRELAEWFNREVLRAALRESETDALAGEVENLHRLLTDEDVSRGNRIETELRLERAGVDVAAVRRDFVSHQTVYNYLTDVRGVERGGESGPDADDVRSRVGRLAGRLEAVAADGLESLADRGDLSLGSVRVNVRVAVYCDDCGRQFDLPTLFERGRCACDGE